MALTTGLLLCELFGFDVDEKTLIPLHVHTDSKAVRSIALRGGVIPKVMHLGIRALHCQQVFEEGRAQKAQIRADVTQRLLPLLKLERVGLGESESKTGPKAREAEVQWTRGENGRMFRARKLRGRTLAGVVIASLAALATRAEGSSAIASSLVDQGSEGCQITSTQVEYCSHEVVIQRAMEQVQVQTHLMWAIGLSMMLIIMRLAFTLDWYVRKDGQRRR
eukprot:756782-Amphidinium_carterae.1